MTTEATELTLADVPAPARQLGFAGLAPFAALSFAALALDGEAAAMAASLLIGYGAVILSFMGGCRWGFAAAGLGDGPSFALLGVSVLPALYAWITALAPAPAAALLLAAGFGALYLADVRLTRAHGAPNWWPALRIWLSSGAVIALVVSALG